MRNEEIARLFYLIADLLEIQNVQFKPIAYRRAAQSIEGLSEGIELIYEKGGLKSLEEIPAIGVNVALKIEEYLKTGKMKHLEELKKQVPIDESLLHIGGLGPKRIKLLYNELGIKTVDDLEKAAKAGKIKNIRTLGAGVEENILEAIQFFKSHSRRFILGYIQKDIDLLVERLKKSNFTERVEVCGSARRKKETIGDLDILAISKNSSKLIDFFTKLNDVQKVLGKGLKKSTVLLQNGLQVDLRVLDKKYFGAAMQYFIGSKEHNVSLRKLAISKKYKLSEYGLFKGKKVIAGENEKDIYNSLGLDFIPYEIRENSGEIEAALKHKLPKLVELKDIQGDCHMHTLQTDGTCTMEQMIEAAIKLGRKYIVFTDHTKALGITNGLDEKALLQQIKKIEKMNKKYSEITILSGAELNILDDGNPDIDNKVLKQLDVVVGSVHTGFKQDKEKITRRTMKAMENENIDIIGHPTGRKIQVREPFAIDLNKVMEKAKETETALEINSYPQRLDLKDVHIREAVNRNVKLVISTDSHHTSHLEFMKFGVDQARRGWAEKKNILNTLPLDKFLKNLK